MHLFVPKESVPGETRTALTPTTAARLAQLGATVIVEPGLGLRSGFPDDDYLSAGAALSTNRRESLHSADLVLRVRRPPADEIPILKPGSIHISFLDPFQDLPLVDELAGRGVAAVSMEMIPRITRAQKMDALSSQASLAGYVAVLLAAAQLNRIFPMMMTAAGTIAPARVLVLGAGVAGLQAIATARRLGAVVESYDTRPVVEEQVRSLGARFLKIDLGETGQTAGGYAKSLTDDQLRKQREALTRFCRSADVVLTAAQVFGRRAPILLTAQLLDALRPGTVVVDLAVESGGNVEGIVPDRVIDRAGVHLIGHTNLAGHVPAHASQVYASNLLNFVEEFWDRHARRLDLKPDDEIIRGCLLTRDGRVCHEQFQSRTPATSNPAS